MIHELLEIQASPDDFERCGEEVTDRFEIIPRKLFITRHVRPKYRNIKDRTETLGSASLQIDETPIRDLEPGVGKAPRGYLWLANDPHGSLYYHWGIGRGQSALIETSAKTTRASYNATAGPPTKPTKPTKETIPRSTS